MPYSEFNAELDAGFAEFEAFTGTSFTFNGAPLTGVFTDGPEENSGRIDMNFGPPPKTCYLQIRRSVLAAASVVEASVKVGTAFLLGSRTMRIEDVVDHDPTGPFVAYRVRISAP